MNDASVPFSSLVRIMATLLGPNGCPWDREQTHASLKSSLLEESYECLEAIDSEDLAHLREELGDLLLQVVFHAALAERDREFTLADVIEELAQKLVRRHPHVFASPLDPQTSPRTAEDVLSTWEKIKREEKNKSHRTSLLDGVPKALPALARATKLSKRAAREAKFDWETPAQVWDKIREEIAELKRAETLDPSTAEGRAALSHELGDLLFAVANLARHHHIDPEETLQATNLRFIARFHWMEGHAPSALADLSLAEKEALWQQAKQALAADEKEGKKS